MHGLTVEEERSLLRSVGIHRKTRKLSPAEVGRLIQKAIESGSTRKECADRLQIGATQVSVFLDLLKLSPEIQHLADWAGGSGSTVAFSSLAQLAGLKEQFDQPRAAEAILTHRLTWKEVVQLLQLKKRSGNTIDQCIDAVLKLRPQIETRHIFVGSIVEGALRSTLSRLPQLQRERLFERALRKVLGAAEGFAGRLGVSKFTIVGPRQPAALLGLDADRFETAINEVVAEEARGDVLSD